MDHARLISLISWSRFVCFHQRVSLQTDLCWATISILSSSIGAEFIRFAQGDREILRFANFTFRSKSLKNHLNNFASQLTNSQQSKVKAASFKRLALDDRSHPLFINAKFEMFQVLHLCRRGGVVRLIVRNLFKTLQLNFCF